MRLKIAVFVIVIVSMLLTIPSCHRKDSSDKVIVRLASVLPAEHPSSKALVFFKERLDELSEGKVEVKLFLNSQLGGAIETAEMCQMDNIEVVFVSAASMTQFIPELNALSMPFIFRDNQHAYAVVDGPVGELFGEKLRKINFDVLAFCDAGSRNIMTKNGPVASPDDLVGMKIRVMGVPLMVDSINALGASAISMGQGEVYTALQTGVIDGWENNPPTTSSFKMYETGCIYYAHTKHLMIPDMLIINGRFYTNLDLQSKAWVDQVALETKQYQRQLWQRSESETIETLKQAGMKFNDVDMSLFQAKVSGVYEKYYQKYGMEFKQICQRIIETQ